MGAAFEAKLYRDTKILIDKKRAENGITVEQRNFLPCVKNKIKEGGIKIMYEMYYSKNPKF